MTEFHCFPHSGGFSYQFRRLARELTPCRVHSVDYPAVDGGESVLGGVRGFIREWLKRRADVDFGRVYFYGQSLGGLMAFEAAAQLEGTGTPAAGVVIAAAMPNSGASPRIDYEAWSDEELLDWSFGIVQGRVPSAEDRVVFGCLSARLRRDLSLYGSYAPGGKLERTRTLLLQGAQDPICPPHMRQYWAERIRQLSWSEIDGGHLFHMDMPEVTAAAVRKWAVA